MKNVQSIYEYLDTYSENEINNVISTLSDEEKQLIKLRYGDDLHNPCTDKNWTLEHSKKYYGILIPKIKKLLLKQNNKRYSNFVDFSFEKKLNDPLIQLIKDKKSMVEISEILNIPLNELFRQLKTLENDGYSFKRKYYSDGRIVYQRLQESKKVINNITNSLNQCLITSPDEKKIKVMLISDLHIGNELQRVDLLDRVYNYCIKNDIRTIICLGDFIDGSYSMGNQQISDVCKQLEYFLNNYPFDKNIITFGIAGDHDKSLLQTKSLDVINICKTYRHDIVLLGYNKGILTIKNDKIFLRHKYSDASIPQNIPILLQGHFHSFKVSNNSNYLYLQVPPLSDLTSSLPSCVELDLSFSYGYINNVIAKQIYFGEKDCLLNEVEYDIPITCDNKLVNNIEKFTRTLHK